LGFGLRALATAVIAVFAMGSVASADASGPSAAETAALGTLVVPSQRRDALVELGEKLEAKGDKAGAVAVYAHAYQEHASHVLLDRIAAMDAVVAARIDFYRPVTMAGPADTLPKDAVDITAVAAKTKKLDVRVLEIRSGRALAVQAGGKWYTRPIAVDTDDETCTIEKFKHVTSEVHDDVVAVTYDLTCGGTTERGVVVVGAGASGKPSATTAITASFVQPDLDVDIQLGWAFAKGTSVDVDAKKMSPWGDGTGRPYPELLVGHHLLVFP
jgi:hypothetical protein